MTRYGDFASLDAAHGRLLHDDQMRHLARELSRLTGQDIRLGDVRRALNNLHYHLTAR